LVRPTSNEDLKAKEIEPKRKIAKRRRCAISSTKIQLKAEKMYKKMNEKPKTKSKSPP